MTDKEPLSNQSLSKRQPIEARRSPFVVHVRAWGPIALAVSLSLAIIIASTQYKEQIEALKGYGYLSAFVIGFLSNATIIVPAPSLVLTTALGGVFNPLILGAVVGAGEALGEMTGYLAGISGKAIAENRDRYEVLCAQMNRHGAWVFFVLALIPNPLFDIAGIAAGMVRFPVWKFLLSVWGGKALKALFFAGAGRQLLG